MSTIIEVGGNLYEVVGYMCPLRGDHYLRFCDDDGYDTEPYVVENDGDYCGMRPVLQPIEGPARAELLAEIEQLRERVAGSVPWGAVELHCGLQRSRTLCFHPNNDEGDCSRAHCPYSEEATDAE